MIFRFILVLLAVAALAPAEAQRRGDWRRGGEQDQAYHGRREGRMRPLREIEGGVVPEMRRRGADYIGAELDGAERPRYRLKFMRNGSVIWVDVDGQTGEVVGRAGDEN